MSFFLPTTTPTPSAHGLAVTLTQKWLANARTYNEPITDQASPVPRNYRPAHTCGQLRKFQYPWLPV